MIQNINDNYTGQIVFDTEYYIQYLTNTKYKVLKIQFWCFWMAKKIIETKIFIEFFFAESKTSILLFINNFGN